jgi:hypothetical protein
MTAHRPARLTALGLNWHPPTRSSPNEVEWEVQLARLAAYKAAPGDCSVPQGWAEDPRLGTWVNKQRTLKRKLDRGEPSEGMTVERAARLTALASPGTSCELSLVDKTECVDFVFKLSYGNMPYIGKSGHFTLKSPNFP